MPGALLLSVVYLHSPWIHKQFYRGEVVFLGTVYVEGGSPCKLAGLPKPWLKEVFMFFSKHKGFLCYINIFKVKIYPLRLSGFHGSYGGCLPSNAIYTPFTNCKQNVNKMLASL